MVVTSHINHFKVAESKFGDFCTKHSLTYSIDTDPDDDDDVKHLVLKDKEGRSISMLDYDAEHEEFLFYIFFMEVAALLPTKPLKTVTRVEIARSSYGFSCEMVDLTSNNSSIHFSESKVKTMMKKFFNMELISSQQHNIVSADFNELLAKYDMQLSNNSDAPSSLPNSWKHEPSYYAIESREPLRDGKRIIFLSGYKDAGMEDKVFLFFFKWATVYLENNLKYNTPAKNSILEMNEGYLGIDEKELYLNYSHNGVHITKNLASHSNGEKWSKDDIDYLIMRLNGAVAIQRVP